MPIRRKLIEVSIPLEAINKASAREKSIRHGHPSTLHLWWARRPLAACRAVLFAQLVDDPSAWPDRFPTEEVQETERKRLHRVIERLVPWEASNNEEILNEARWEIARSVAWGLGEEPPPRDDGVAILAYLQAKAPPVYDPFSGGGSIPLEAQRLGLRAYGSDLNPVAVLIGKALVEIPPKFAGMAPVNPVSRTERARGGRWQGKRAQGLAEDVRYYGQWMRKEATRRIGNLYPKATLPDGKEATVIAWLWARTVRSPDPAAKGSMVPLVSSYLLSTNGSKRAWAQPVFDSNSSDGWHFAVASGELSQSDESKLKEGTVGRKGAVCILSGVSISLPYIRTEAQAGRLGARLMAIVLEGKKGRDYISPIASHEKIASEICLQYLAETDQELAFNPRDIKAPIYGMTKFSSLFSKRQANTLSVFCDLTKEVRKQVLDDALSQIFPDDVVRLADGGRGLTAYADAVTTYLAFAVDKAADYWSGLCSWHSSGEKMRNTFGRQAIPMVWDYAECNVFSSSTGNWMACVDWVWKAIAAAPTTSISSISLGSAQNGQFQAKEAVFSTDPPYYDNIGYAELSDFFYVWLRTSVAEIWPQLFRRLTTPKNDELVATPYRHGGKVEAEAFFMRGMTAALEHIRRAAVGDIPVVIYYAFRQSETDDEGLTSAGWASFLQGVVDAGFAIDGTWPVRTEMGSKIISTRANILASSIVLVCRRRMDAAPIAARTEFLGALKQGLPKAIDDIRKAGVGPVDMQQSVIGPGMGIFTHFNRVLEDDDSTMTVKTALALINRVWQEIENELDTAFDASTQVALAWFSTYGFDTRPSGDLITIANAKNISVGMLFTSGVFQNLHGKAGLVARADLPKAWALPKDRAPTVWECIQHTARVLNAADGGATAASALVAKMDRQQAEAARALAYRLFEIAKDKGWAAEALVYNELAEEWPHLEDLAAAAAPAPQLNQADMFQELR